MRAYGGAARSHNAVLIQFVTVQLYWKQAEKNGVRMGVCPPAHHFFGFFSIFGCAGVFPEQLLQFIN
ncbi:MAG TPA: hypothetical protein VMT91_15395 [Anaerolineales bacterium]|nr:hypothetical protein [Anaerolineales bacterium]